MEFLRKLLICIFNLFNKKKVVVVRVEDKNTSEKKQGIKGNRNFNAMRWNKED